MKNRALSLLTVILMLALVSWGGVGHKTVATIAENHLTPAAKSSIKALLGDQSIADIASWADEVRNTPEYKQTGPWHYINLPLGLSYDEFKSRVENMLEANVYSALVNQLKLLTDSTVPRDK